MEIYVFQCFCCSVVFTNVGLLIHLDLRNLEKWKQTLLESDSWSDICMRERESFGDDFRTLPHVNLNH